MSGIGGLSHDELVVACKNIGFDLTCATCASVFYTGMSLPGDTHTCAPATHPVSCMLAKRLLDDVWDGQWTTRNAAKNMVCAHGCAKENTYEDQLAHERDCRFVKLWCDELKGLREFVGESRGVVVKGGPRKTEVPRIPPPEAMHGYCDQDGGSDF